MSTIEPLPIRVVQALGITTSLVLAGAIASISHITTPVLSTTPPSTFLPLWTRLYARGAATAPPLAVLSTACFLYLAYSASDWTGAYATAAAATLAIVPYTLLFMMGTNRRLEARAKMVGASAKEDGGRQEESRALLEWWTVLNFGRSVLPLVGGLVGLWSVMG